MTDACASYYDEDGCLVTPECPAIEHVPAHVDQSPIVGWTAGANSNARIDGDASLRFMMPPNVVGVIIGFKHSAIQPTRPALVEHGFYFQRAAGADYLQVIEQGVTKTTLRPRHASDLFEVRRVGGAVSYWQNGIRIYQSARPSVGKILVNTCLYSSGDAVPARFDPDAPPPGAPGTNPLTLGATDIAFIVMEQPDSGFAQPQGGTYAFIDEGVSALIDPSQSGLVGTYDAAGDFDGHVRFDIDPGSADIDAVMFALFPFGENNSVSVTSYHTSGPVFVTVGNSFEELSYFGTIESWPSVGGALGGTTAGSPYLEKVLGDGDHPYVTFTAAELTAAGFDDYLASASGVALVGAAVRISNGAPGLDVVFTAT